MADKVVRVAAYTRSLPKRKKAAGSPAPKKKSARKRKK